MQGQLFLGVAAFASTLGYLCRQSSFDPCPNSGLKLAHVCIQTSASQCTFASVITSLLILYISKVEGREGDRRNRHLCDQLNSVYSQ